MLHGPPNVPFEYWEWLQDGDDLADGTSLVAPYEAYTSGNYSLFLYDGLCKEESQPMRLTVEHCSDCGAAAMDATIICTPDDPASYTIKLTIASLPAGTTYTVWTDIGPVSGFTGVLTGSSPYVLYLTFTTLYLPPPSSLTAYMVFTLPSGQKCGLHANAAVPSCPWIEERHANNGDTGKYVVTPVMPVNDMATAMMVFPNPASGMVNVSYDYGMATYAEKTLTVYDITGRKISIATPADIHGTWSLNTDSWTPGIYIIRMEADGKPLHTQRVVVSH